MKKSSWLIMPLENGFIVMRDDAGGRAANGPRWCARSKQELASLIVDLIAEEELGLSAAAAALTDEAKVNRAAGAALAAEAGR